MEFNMPDTLVLKIVESRKETGETDSTLYILYDQRKRTYIIRGSREGVSTSYSFECFSERDLADFIDFIVDGYYAYVSYSLYNYDNLPETSGEITFDFLCKYDDRSYELAGYTDCEYKRKHLIRQLRILKKIFNDY